MQKEEMTMFMTANRLKVDGKIVLKLNLHEFAEEEIPFLNSLGINKIDDTAPNWRYILIHSQEEFLAKREELFSKYRVVEEKGPKVTLALK